MAVITYTQDAVLGAYQQWLMQEGARACLQREWRGQEAPPRPRPSCGPYAQAGSLIRYTVSTTLSSLDVFFSGQFQNAAGMWQTTGETVRATAAGGVTQIVRPVTEGAFANLVASVGSATVGDGEAYTLVELGRMNNGQFTPYAVLAGGYPASNQPIDACAGSFQQNRPQTGGGGGACVCPSTYEIEAIDGITSAQGWQVNRTPAANTVERIVVMNFAISTGGSAGNRYMFVENVIVGAGPVFYQRTPANIPASTDMTFQVNVDIGAGSNEADVQYGAIPGSLWYSQEYQMQVGIGGFLSGDTVNDAYAIIEVRE